MDKIIIFKDLKVWQKAHELTLFVYQITKNFPPEERYGMISQMRRASISFACNIVEGFRRKSLKDSLNFYNMADSSLEELKYQLMLSYDLKYINESDYKKANDLCEEGGKMLYGWMKFQKEKLK